MTKSVFTDAYRIFTDFLRASRVDANLSQTELAKRIGKPQQFISFIERGERRVDVVEFYALMRALGRDPKEAFGSFTERLPEEIDI